ncbi:hypothetical protein [Streptococcus ferus]|uniref:hypothetical protein n=1 Tax=Streptococcus ferus TaxID=1345 RepID=UPI002355BF97|nr:hypothetical protein [Streptococcus ferus]
MTNNKGQKLKWVRFLTAQIPAVCLLVMVVTQSLFKSPLIVQLCFLVITFSVAFLNYYFIKEIKKEVPNGTSATVLNQFIGAFVFLLLTILSAYKASQATTLYSSIILYSAAVISFVFVVLLLWGVKYAWHFQKHKK